MVTVVTTLHKIEEGFLYLKGDVVADVTHFDLVLIHFANILLHLNDTSGGQGVFTSFLSS